MFQNYKYISCGKKVISGRCNNGSITIWHRGGGHKANYKFIDFFRRPSVFVYKVCGFEYDANRSSFVVMLVSKYKKKNIYTRILYSKGLVFGSLIRNCKKNVLSYNIGDSFFIQDLPVGAFVHNIEKTVGFGGKFIRAAGSFGQILQKSSKQILVKIPSGKLVFFSYNTRCTFGIVGNENYKLIVIGKAGRSRWIGYRPIVRGVAINPIDHPHGGGEGKSQIGKHPVSPWGKLTKGKKTR
jgi:large subunit ribosomal protein L2